MSDQLTRIFLFREETSTGSRLSSTDHRFDLLLTGNALTEPVANGLSANLTPIIIMLGSFLPILWSVMLPKSTHFE